ncbi:MAG: hemerythrin domain-containing protein [Verrucomicrobia bacterium]|nr:hemerythrin domain-containing protein [Verrucomicrobiota bacterium]
MKITDILTVEHTVFRTFFDQAERALPGLKTAAEIKLLARLAEKLLHSHGESEQDLAYAVLDHMLKEKGHLSRLYSDHREMDARMEQVCMANDLAEARQLMQSAMIMSREHFRYEEQTVFPLIDQVLQNKSLVKLGEAWKQKYAGLTG